MRILQAKASFRSQESKGRIQLHEDWAPISDILQDQGKDVTSYSGEKNLLPGKIGSPIYYLPRQAIGYMLPFCYSTYRGNLQIEYISSDFKNQEPDEVRVEQFHGNTFRPFMLKSF